MKHVLNAGGSSLVESCKALVRQVSTSMVAPDLGFMPQGSCLIVLLCKCTHLSKRLYIYVYIDYMCQSLSQTISGRPVGGVVSSSPPGPSCIYVYVRAHTMCGRGRRYAACRNSWRGPALQHVLHCSLGLVAYSLCYQQVT